MSKGCTSLPAERIHCRANLSSAWEIYDLAPSPIRWLPHWQNPVKAPCLLNDSITSPFPHLSPPFFSNLLFSPNHPLFSVLFCLHCGCSFRDSIFEKQKCFYLVSGSRLRHVASVWKDCPSNVLNRENISGGLIQLSSPHKHRKNININILLLILQCKAGSRMHSLKPLSTHGEPSTNFHDSAYCGYTYFFLS